MPYVYRLDHPITGEFYIGYRMANVNTNMPSDQDFSKYKTSSNKIKPRFEEFNWYIVAEFFDADSAYDFEQLLIFESWEQPGSLNKSCYHGKTRFIINGPAIGNNAKGVPRLKHKCPHCGVKVDAGNLSKYHGYNCISLGPRLQTGLKAKGIPATGKRAKGIPQGPMPGKGAKGMAKTGNNAKGVTRPKHKCPHCDVMMSANNLVKKHGDKCSSLAQ